jgi:hypothetical protein
MLTKSGQAGAVPASLNYDASSRTLTLDPNTDLATSATYGVTVMGGIDGVAGEDGTPLAANVNWSFTTSSIPNVGPPSIEVSASVQKVGTSVQTT